MEFLDSAKTDAAIERLLKEASYIRAAVAYWGDGAVERLGLDKVSAKDVLIVCDFQSGACNTSEIKRLRMVLGRNKVLTLDQLHAKVWLTDTAAIVGSSNAGAIGLGYEGAEIARLTEANILITEPGILKQIKAWFDKLVSKKASRVSEAQLLEAASIWHGQRVSRPMQQMESVIDELGSNPASLADRNIFVWIWQHEDADKWTAEIVEEERKNRGGAKVDFWQDVRSGDKIPPGSHVIEFDTSKTGKPRFSGIYRVLADDPFVRSEGGTMLFCMEVPLLNGRRLGNFPRWEAAAALAIKERREWEGTVEDFAKYLVKV